MSAKEEVAMSLPTFGKLIEDAASLRVQMARLKVERDREIARALSAEEELKVLREHCVSEHDCTFCGLRRP